MKTQRITRAIGAPLDRIDGVQKVTGTATYAYEYPVEGVTYVFPVQSTIARGRVSSIDASAAQALPGVIAVLSHENAPRLAPVDDAELAVFQSDAIAYHGQFVAAVVAETSEIARQAASLVVVRYQEQPHDVELSASRGDFFTPEKLGGVYEADTESGDVEAALTSAAVSLDHTYTTPAEHNNPLEPHATIAIWSDEGLTLYDSNQGGHIIRDDVAAAFRLSPERVHLEIGDSALPRAFVAGASSGTISWGWAICNAASALRTRLHEEYGGSVPAGGLSASGAFETNPEGQQFSMHAFGAQFAEVRINADTGEVRVPRLLGVFAAGRIINPKTARSQLLGGMTMGLSMALHEASVLDPRFGDYVNHDLAEYHIATNADVGTIDVTWIEEEDPHVNPMGAKGIGELGIVGTTAAIANAVYHATGIRVRDLPITLDKLLLCSPLPTHTGYM